MSSKLELDVGIGKLTLDLSELTSAIWELGTALIGADKKAARESLKAMVEELRKTYEAIVEALVPLYNLTTEQQFSAAFGNAHDLVKDHYLKKRNDARHHCYIIISQLNTMRQDRSWMRGLPLAGKAFERLEKICNEWVAVDTVTIAKMESFFTSLNDLVDQIVEIRQAGESQSFSVLRHKLKAAEPMFLDIRAQLHQLDELGRTL